MRVNILPAKLILDQHLIAEKRELRMIPPLLKKRVDSGKHTTADIPTRFTLGKGHMIFWLNKMLYLSKRYDALIEEMIRRDFKPDLSLKFDMDYAVRYKMDNDWEPNFGDYSIILSRLKEKILQKPDWYRYCGQPVSHKKIEIIYGGV